MATVALLPTPELQFIDANGHPYAGGTLATYVPSSTTPKSTWVDPNQDALNTNPIVLDAAGRCICYGDGDYRLVLHDVTGNLIFDQPSSTVVSAALYPVVSAPTIADAVALLGIEDDINAAVANEAALREAADTAEANARAAADTTLQNNLNAETTRAEAEEAHLQSEIDAINAEIGGIPGPVSTLGGIRAGTLTTDSSGNFSVAFTPAFASKCIYFAVVDPNATFDATTGEMTTWVSVYFWPGTTGTGSLSTTHASGQLVQNDQLTVPPSLVRIGSPLTIDWYALGF